MADIDLPEIRGISARGWESDEDWAAIARLLNANMTAVGVDIHVTADEVRGWLANADDIDRDSDFMFVEVGDEVVGYTLSSTYMEESGRRIYRHNCRVDPRWQDKGIGRALLDWDIAYNEERASTLGRGTLQTHAVDDDLGLKSLLTAAGYESVQHEADLVRPDLEDIPDRPLPEGAEIRPVEDDHLRAVYDSDKEAFKDHWGATPPTAGDWKAFLEFAHRDESLWKVAWHGDEVIGQVRGYVNAEENNEFARKRGYAEFISTAREWRGRGVASALICETLREFKRRGLEEAALGVHVENPTGAYSLYQRLGFEIVSTGTTYERPLG